MTNLHLRSKIINYQAKPAQDRYYIVTDYSILIYPEGCMFTSRRTGNHVENVTPILHSYITIYRSICVRKAQNLTKVKLLCFPFLLLPHKKREIRIMKKLIALILALAMITSLLGGCSSPKAAASADSSSVSESDPTASSPGTSDGGSSASASSDTGFTITDVNGTQVKFDKQPETFVVANYIFNFLLVGGKSSLKKVVGLTKDGWKDVRYGEYTSLTKAYPEINDIESIGGYHDDVLNRELILELAPDCLLISNSQYTENETSIPVWEKAGIKVVVLDYHKMILEHDIASTTILGRLLGKEDTAAELCSAYTNGIDLVQKRIAGLPDDKKQVKVYTELGNLGADTLGNSYDGILWGAIVNNLGAVNIAKGKLSGSYGPLDKEYILEQNPDIIIIGGSVWSGDTKSTQMRMGLTVDEALAQKRLEGFAARPWWQNLNAVKNGEIYGVDHGSLRNALDYTFTEYLAKIIYPDLFKDLDPQAEYEHMLNKYLPEVTETGTFMIKLKPAA